MPLFASVVVLDCPHQCKPCTLDSLVPTGAAWGARLPEAEDELVLTEMSANVYTDWPTGTSEFIATLEAQFGIRLHRKLAGGKQ